MTTRVQAFNPSFIGKLSTRTLFYLCSALLVSTFLFYAYLVNRTIMNVVARERIESQAAELSSEIGNLEFTYMAEKNRVTIDVAYARGFRDAAPTKFIPRNDAPVLSFNSGR